MADTRKTKPDAVLCWILFVWIKYVGAQADDTDDDDKDDEDEAMLIFAYVAFALGGVLVIIALVLLITWWSKTRKRRKQRYLRSNFQSHSSDPWLKNSANTHRVQTQVGGNDAGDLTNLDVRAFEGRTSGGQHNTDSLRTQQARRHVSRAGSGVNTNGHATTGNHVNRGYHNPAAGPLPVTLIDAVSSEESSATHTSTSPIISSKDKMAEPEPDYDNYESPRHRYRPSESSTDVPTIVAELEPEPASIYARRAQRSEQPETLTTSDALAALDAATEERVQPAPSDFAVDGIFLNANSLERRGYERRPPSTSSSTMNSQRLRSGYSSHGNEALRDDREVIYNVTLTVS